MTAKIDLVSRNQQGQNLHHQTRVGIIGLMEIIDTVSVTRTKTMTFSTLA
ncbi:MAG TPA: hypothetical protein PLN33_00540 [Hyphomonadaceae bacterium]|nr:hypothetical protein [Hyphomonadaceae bacterium]HPN05040.1 hypothetical protein [Hyphomonadaceae bacterium]